MCSPRPPVAPLGRPLESKRFIARINDKSKCDLKPDSFLLRKFRILSTTILMPFHAILRSHVGTFFEREKNG